MFLDRGPKSCERPSSYVAFPVPRFPKKLVEAQPDIEMRNEMIGDEPLPNPGFPFIVPLMCPSDSPVLGHISLNPEALNLSKP